MRKAVNHLKKSDPVMAAIIQRVGKFTLQYREPSFETLVRSIVYQQLSGRVASVIFARLHAADVLAERILSPGDWLRNAHVEATKAAVCRDTPGIGLVYAPRTPGIAGFSEDQLRPAPDIGADSRAVLLDAGFEPNAIDDLIKTGAVRIPVR